MSLKSFLRTYEFQVSFKIDSPSLRPIDKSSNQTYTPSTPFDFESKEGKVLFYDKLPYDYYTKPSERYEEIKIEKIRKNILQYLATIINPIDLENEYFSLEILENAVSAVRD